MKSFEKLTTQQKQEAKKRICDMILESVNAGIIVNVSDGKAIDAYANIVAEDALYSEAGYLVIDEAVDQWESSFMDRDTFRSDEPSERQFFFVVCQDCQWVSDAESTEDELPSLEECPECQSGDLEVESEYS